MTSETIIKSMIFKRSLKGHRPFLAPVELNGKTARASEKY